MESGNAAMDTAAIKEIRYNNSMKDYQFNLIYGTNLAIFSRVIEPGWIAAVTSTVALGYIITGIIQYIKDR